MTHTPEPWAHVPIFVSDNLVCNAIVAGKQDVCVDVTDPEDELGITLESGEIARAALAKAGAQ